jgi:Tol biopolymer transport system component
VSAGGRRIGLAAVAALALGCGRLGYEPLEPDAATAQPCETWTPWSAPTQVPGVSSSVVDDWSPSITADGLELAFASWRVETSHIWLARRERRAAPFEQPAMVEGLATSDGEYGPWLSPDGLTLLFAAFGPSGPWDLWQATRPDRGASFGPRQRLAEVSSSASEHSPWLSPDGLRLYFTSDRGGTYNVWKATRAAPGDAFDAPRLLEEVSSASSERTVALSSDERELYVSSTRPGGAGGHDLWVSRRADREAPWPPPENLAELNTAFDDIYAFPSSDGAELYLNIDTDILGGRRSDLWVATRACAP